MTKQEKLAFRILASLYPDSRPSEIRKIIDDALAKDERSDDIELWAALTKEKAEKSEPDMPVKEKVIERHYYHNYPWYTSNVTLTGTCSDTITCGTCDASSVTISGFSNNASDSMCSLSACDNVLDYLTGVESM